MKRIRLFMWGYQHYFQISANGAAERIFCNLVKGLNARAFLVGVWHDDTTKPTSFPVCLEPEDDCGYDPNIFTKLKEIAQKIEENDPERQVFHSDPTAQENHERRIKLNSFRKGILSILNPFDEQQNLVSFASFPVNVEGYMVCTILQFNKEGFENVYSLKEDTIHGRYPISTSLLDATISEYLNGCAKALQEPNPGSGLDILGREVDEIIRSAGKRLMTTLAWVSYGHRFDLFEICNMISAQRYEGAEGTGRMVIAPRDHKSIREVITLAKDVALNEYRGIRKLLEMASDNQYLLSDSNVVYGLGTIGEYDPSNEDLFIVEFTKHFTWRLCHDDHVMMQVSYRQPEYVKEKMNKKKFYNDLRRIFEGIEDDVIAKLWTIIEVATEQKHGTMVVISSGAKEEADRLRHQSTCINPVEITSEIMRMVTSIDGAVLIDPKGICYAIGVILDGLANEKGDPSRGARYNSAIRYVESQNYECLIVVVSEDGYISLVPDLRLQIRRTSIDMVLSELEKINDSTEVNIKYFNQLMGWLDSHRFYLLEDDCKQANRLRDEIQPKLETNIRVVYSDFVPNTEMNESYYLNE